MNQMVPKDTARSTQQIEYTWEYDQEELYLSFPIQADVKIFVGEPRITIQSDLELYFESAEDSNVFSLVAAEHVQSNKAVVKISIPEDQVSRLWLRLGYGSIHVDSACIGELHVQGGNTSVCVGSGCCIPKFSINAKHGDCFFVDAMQSKSCSVKIANGSVRVPLAEFEGSKELALGLGYVEYAEQQVRVAEFHLSEQGVGKGKLAVRVESGNMQLL